jgi:hypothetical protein
MQSNEPTPVQIDLIRQLVRSVTPNNAHAEYEKARSHFTSQDQLQAALRVIELELQQHLMLVEPWNHMAGGASRRTIGCTGQRSGRKWR